jgi:hypothetical protein
MKHKSWFDEKCSKLLDQRKQVKLQWLQDQSEENGNNRNDITHEASRYFRNKRGEYLEIKSMSLQRTAITRISEACIEE